MLFNRLLTPTFFVLFLTGLFGSNTHARMNGEAVALDPWGNVEQVLEVENESSEDSIHPEDHSGAGFDGNGVPDFSFFTSQSLTDSSQAYPALICQTASIRQSQINLLLSFHAPAIFILFHSYQGYLS